MDLKLMLAHTDAIRRLMHLLCQSQYTPAQLEAQFSRDTPVQALLNCMEDAGFLLHTGKYLSLHKEHLEQLQQILNLYTAVQEQQAEQDFTNFLSAQRENEQPHAMFGTEAAFFESVVSGNSDTVHLLYSPLGGKGYGKLSSDPLRNLKYHLIITISMLTRYCIPGGMPQEEAFSLSDLYIQRVDAAQTEQQIRLLHYQVIRDFTGKMRRLQDNTQYSPLILKAMNYISIHLHSRIFVQDVADDAGVSAPHLSRLFQTEVHLSLSEYIAIKKIEAAKDLLQYTEQPASAISMLLNFSSQSYFIKVFQKYTGMTPKEFRRQFHENVHFR